jgi:60 kDa SS-A/Ro ribonucleoprotein
MNYVQHVSARHTPQSQPVPNKPMVDNLAGGFSFVVDDWTRLHRFLVLGGEKGTYYVSERKLTVDSAACVKRCLDADPARTVRAIIDVSEGGRAPKNAPAVFALALAAAHPKGKEYALGEDPHATPGQPLQRVCRIPTDLFAFVEAVQELRGWGRALRTVVGDWYRDKGHHDPRSLAYQMAKYQSRDGWTHRDLLRLAHPKASDATTQELFHWAVKGWPGVGEGPHPNAALLPIWAMEKAKRATSKDEVVKLIRDYDLVRECVPTQFLTEPEVWEALLEKMPLTALVRNLATMTRIGLLAPMSRAVGKVLADLTNGDRIAKARLHPIAILSAMLTYKAGHGEKSDKTWTPVPQIVDALDGAFYLAFRAIEPTGKRWCLGLDVSGSMNGTMVNGLPGMSAVMAEAAMALVTAATEPQHAILAFDTTIKNVAISPRQRLVDAVVAVKNLVHGGTDCAQPILWAMANKVPVDVFAIYTDSATWQGSVHPFQALNAYRQQMGIPAKLVTVAMCATEFTLCDGDDAGSLNVAGFDTAAPQVMREFVAD